MHENPVHKPLANFADFLPNKSCSEYVGQECQEAMPSIRKYVKILLREAALVATSILDAGFNKNLRPPLVFALVSPR